MPNNPELLRQVVGAVDEKLQIVPYRWNPSTLAYEVETVSTGTGSDVNVTNTSIPVTSAQLPAALDVSGGLKVAIVAGGGGGSSGGLTNTELRATPVPVDASGSTVPVSGPLTDTQLRATAVPVSGPLTDAQLRATAVPVSGALTDTQLRAAPVPVSGSVTANIGTSGSLALDATVSGVAKDGAAITGQALEAGGASIMGWLSSIRKAITDRLGTLGQKTMAGSTPVAIASDQSGVPVTGTFFQGTQPVSLAAAVDVSDRGARAVGVVTTADGGQVTVGAKADAVWDGASAASGISIFKYIGQKIEAVRALLAATLTISGTVTALQPARIQVSLFAEAVAGAASEALVSFSISQGFAAPSTATSYTVPVGKTLRIHTIIRTWVATTTTANTSRTRLRVNASGAAIISSPIAYSSRMGWESATFIANEAERDVISLGEGIDVAAGGGVGMTHLEAAANGTLDITILGYLY